MSALVLPIVLLSFVVVIKLLEWALEKKSSADSDLLVGLPELSYKPPPLASDIQPWVDRDFAEEDRAEAIQTLRMSELDERCQRCALHLAEGELPKLKQAVELGQYDWRDLITAAEYGGGFFGIFRQVHDFSQAQTIPRSPAPRPETAD